MSLPGPADVLAKYFGYATFRPGQQEVVDSVLAGKDALVVMPTGGGKSICYQVPALVLPGMALVVSPLIALMKDQVDALLANGIPAAYLNSTQNAAAARDVWDNAKAGKLKLLYVSPERLLGGSEFEGMLGALQSLNISMVAIDEAHCISAWGHDFRPEYTQLGKLRGYLPNTPVMALTATADKLTRADIATHLNLRTDRFELVASFDRPNIYLSVQPADGRTQQIGRFIKKRKGQAGIVYCLARKTCETLASYLEAQGIRAAAYHAGLSHLEREKVQEGFIKDDIDVVCATIAFGMGIDKSNVRFVLHYNLPKNLEGYYQEIGRAGRDGLASEALLFYSYADVAALTEMMQKEAASADRQSIVRAKLERMQQFAETPQCRRRVLLAYFGQQVQQDCGHCDVCQNPRQRIDATLIAQKALSAVARCQERVGRNLLIEVLRGNRSAEVIRHGYDQIKTFGASKDLAPFELKDYLVQLINGGYLEIAYDKHQALQITPLGRQVLFDGLKVMLAKPEKYAAGPDTPTPTAAGPIARDAAREEILALLKRKRKALADEAGLAPYQVFSDATLEDMVTYLPTTEDEFLQVSGVGAYKAELYWEDFTGLIRTAVQTLEQSGQHLARYRRMPVRRRNGTATDGPKPPKEDTRLATFKLYQAGKSIEEISTERGIGADSILGHLCQLFLQGYEVNLSIYLNRANFFEVKAAIEAEGGLSNQLMRPVFDRLQGRFTYGQIRIARTFLLKGALPDA